MSLDATLSSIEKSLSRIAAALEARSTVASVAAPVQSAPIAVAAFQYPASVPTPAPVQQPQPAPVQQPQPAPVAAPVFAAPAPVAATNNPFGKDEQGNEQNLNSYAMSAYRTMGPIKGARIQQVLGELGRGNLNELQPDQYAQFVAKVEELKVSP